MGSAAAALPAQENLHLGLAMLLRRGNSRVSSSWSNKALLAEVERVVALTQIPRDGLFAVLDEPGAS